MLHANLIEEMFLLNIGITFPHGFTFLISLTRIVVATFG